MHVPTAHGQYPPVMDAFLVAACAVLGLAVGSFLNVVIWRVPRQESVVSPRSRCTRCGTELGARDNVPILSWLILRGRCRTCGASISSRYPLVEALTAVLFALVAVRFGWDAALPAFLVLVAGLVALSGIDLDHHRLPNVVLYPVLSMVGGLLVVATLATGHWANLGRAATGGAIGFGLLLAIHLVAPTGMGFGDVRLAGVIGVALGWMGVRYVLLGLFLSFLLSAVVGVGLIATGVRSRKDRIPFGPFLAAGAVVATLAGSPLLRWYGV